VVQFYGKVTHLPETSELVVVAVPANTVPQVVEEAGQAGPRPSWWCREASPRWDEEISRRSW
jgi:acyl-CoA synthetase (NDP forming)